MIKEFLVGLGFGVDESSLAKFNKAINSATVRVTALYASIQLTAAAIFKGVADISESFEQMGYEYRLIAPAINKALLLRRELLKAYSTAGINITKVIQESVKFNFSLAKTKYALEALYKSVGAKFIPLLTKQMDIFRSKIYANMPKIQEALKKFVTFIFKAFEATVQLGSRLWSILTRVYDFFVMLDEKTGGWSTKILAVIAAWRMLNLAFLATPLGMLLTGFIALLALYDDFKTAQEGGKSFFDWKLGPMKYVLDILKQLVDYAKTLAELFWDIGHGDFKGTIGDLEKLARIFWSLNGLVDKLIKSFHIEWMDSLLAKRDKIENSIFSTFGGGNAPYFNPANFASQPLLSPAVGSSSNQTVSQQTQITVQGSADANAIGKSVANEQQRVNFDMGRNLKGAMR